MQLQFPLLARHAGGTKVSGIAGAPGTAGKMNELSQEDQSKPMAAGNTRCDEQAARRGHFVSSCTKPQHTSQWD